ncbi:MAG: hypothetical protein K9J06_05910 [Flavobacteriales bacterium]|nr:hypothetical protein [Flavobacteriales bacterium]
MDIQLSVEESKAKQFLAFLRQLDFITVKKTTRVKSEHHNRIDDPKGNKDLPYFGLCPEWDVEADELRHGGISKRVVGW